MHFSNIIASLVLCGATIVTALPAAEPGLAAVTTKSSKSWSNMHVLIRQSDGSYAHSEDMADEIRARPEVANLLGKDYSKQLDQRASSATVQACSASNCSNCRTIFSGSFNSNTQCLEADNTSCLIISNLNNANVEFWNHKTCNGNNSVYRGCGQNTAQVAAPGNNSIGVHTGC